MKNACEIENHFVCRSRAKHSGECSFKKKFSHGPDCCMHLVLRDGSECYSPDARADAVFRLEAERDKEKRIWERTAAMLADFDEDLLLKYYEKAKEEID